VNAAARSSIAASLVFGISVLLVMTRAPWWCVLIGLTSVAWRVLVMTGHLPRPKRIPGLRFLLGAVTAALVAAVALNFRTLNGLEAGTALLVVMGALKVIESRARRDDAIVIGAVLFLLLAAALAGGLLIRRQSVASLAALRAALARNEATNRSLLRALAEAGGRS